jgi:hypothetical protein
MPEVILLTAGQASQVRGPSDVAPMVGLMPVALTDGRFYLPTTVLAAPQFAADHDFLADLPTTDFASVQSLLPVGP